MPLTGEQRAGWVLLSADEHGYTVQPQLTAYDVDHVLTMMETVHHPSCEWLRGKYRR